MESITPDQGKAGSAPPAAGEVKSIWSIMLRVFTGPVEAFNGFRQKPRIIVPLIVTFVLIAVAAAVMAPYQGQMQVDLLSKSETIPPQVLDQLREQAQNPNPINGIVGGIVAVFIIDLIGALVAWFIGSFIMGGEAKFKEMWGATVLGGLIIPFGGIIRALMTLARGDAHVSLGLAALFPGKDFTSIFYSILYYFDAFGIWCLIVTGIGYSIVLGISRGRGFVTVLIWYILFTIVMIGATVFGLGLAGVDVTFF